MTPIESGKTICIKNGKRRNKKKRNGCLKVQRNRKKHQNGTMDLP